MGYLQTIKSPETYIKMMRAMLFPMPLAERDEVCQEVRQHLEALLEDFQARGHWPEEAMLLASKQFGPPFRVGHEIAQKWDEKRKQQAEATKPALARQRKWLNNLSSAIIIWGSTWCVMNYHNWAIILIWAIGQGILYGAVTGYINELDEQIDEPKEVKWSERQEVLEKSKPKIEEQISQSKKLWEKLILLFVLWFANRLSRKEDNRMTRSANIVWPLTSVSWSLSYLAVLIFCSVLTHWKTFFLTCLIFLYVFGKVGQITRVMMNRLLIRRRMA